VFTAELAPRVAITSPADGASFLLPFSTTLEASVEAEHVVGDATVTFFNGTTSLGVSATNGPYEITVDQTDFPAPGDYSLYAVLDDDFASTTSLVSVLTVSGFAPRVAITSPTNGTSVPPLFNTTLVASVEAAHVVGNATVTFFNGTTSLGVSGMNGPYELALDQDDFPGGGDYELYAVLTDDFASSTSQVSFLTIEALRGLPFEEDFESYAEGDSLDTKDPDGSHPWTATNVVVTTNSWAGSLAAALTSETAVATQTFNDEQTNVWTDLYIQPVFGDNPSVPPPPGSSFAFYVHTNGQVVAFNSTTETQLVHTALVEGQWVQFTVHSDYGTKTWDLYLNGAPTAIGSGLGFFDTGAASYTEFGISGAPSNAVVDEITIGLSDPRPNGADYRISSDGVGFPTGPDWKIDSIEANRILIFLRAQSYHNETQSSLYPDGYGPGTGAQHTPHPADYRTASDAVGVPTGPDWKIDSIEANRILIYLRAQGYHSEPPSSLYPDGYGPGSQ
jgi:hypothetical protein